MNIINDLINELQTNEQICNNIATKTILSSIHNSMLLGIPNDQIVENALSTLESFSKELINENMQEVVNRFRQFAQKPTQRLQNMTKEVGLCKKIDLLKEGNIYKDPVAKTIIDNISALLTQYPENVIINTVSEHLSNFSYDPLVNHVLGEISTYVNENSVKLHILNSLYTLRTTNSPIYSGVCSELENALLENITTADALRMKLHSYSNLPVVSNIINSISMLEAQSSHTFNIGLGVGDTKVSSIIAPFYPLSESEAIVFMNNGFVKISENEEPQYLPLDVVSIYPDFYKVCESIHNLGFTLKNNEYSFTGNKVKVVFSINEDGSLKLLVNGKHTDLKSLNYAETFLVESIETRNAISNIFNNLDYIANIEFGKQIINESSNKRVNVLTIGDNIYVFEQNGDFRKMKDLTFHSYVLENFKYDISDLYSIKLEKRDELLKSIDVEKNAITNNLAKLEESINKINSVIESIDTNDSYADQLMELKVSIEKNMNSLRERYITLSQSKKKI